MLQNLVFSLIFLLLLPLQAKSSLKIFNLPKSLEQEAQAIVDSNKKAQVDFLVSVKNQALQGQSGFVLEFPYYHINTKLKNSNWTSLSKNQSYFSALKEAKKQISQVLFKILLGEKKAKQVHKRLIYIVDKKTKYYIFSEKVFDFKVNSEFSFISTAKVRLKISFLNLKKLLDKEGLLYTVKKRFTVLPMFSLLNTKTGYVQNWWQTEQVPLFSKAKEANSIPAKNKKHNADLFVDLYAKSSIKASSVDRLFLRLKTQFLRNFSKEAKPFSLYFFKPSEFKFQQLFPSPLLKKSSFYPVKLASYLGSDLVLNAELSYFLDEQKRNLKLTLVLKVVKLSSKKTVVVFSKDGQWSLEANADPSGVGRKTSQKIASFLQSSGDQVLKELVDMKNKALLQAYEIVLIAKGALTPVDLYQFISVFKFYVREALDVQLQVLSRSEFHLKLVSTLRPKEIFNKLSQLNLPNYEIKGVSLFSDSSKLSFFLRKLKKIK